MPGLVCESKEESIPRALVEGRPALSPMQQKVADELLDSVKTAAVSLLKTGAGMGKTTILRWLEDTVGAHFISAIEFLKLLKGRSPIAIEESFMDLAERALDEGNFVVIDDLQLLTDVVESFDYQRAGLIDAVLTAILAQAEARNKRIVFAASGSVRIAPVMRRGLSWELDEFEADDFRVIASHYLPDLPAKVDFAEIHRFAPALTGYQLKNACVWLARQSSEPDTESFLEYLRSRNITSNVNLDEVQPVAWSDLKGIHDVVDELEAKIALPLENYAVAAELQLKPKRGVMLLGPPGTGKTTIGRALAHRLKGKFFLIDGTVNADAGDFYERVSNVFEAAKRNAPAVIFIDDADVIFEEGNRGMYRYLLTMLDGLESASSERVCVMLTAMDGLTLPPALLRSGRVELWLRTRLPDERARGAILSDKLKILPDPLDKVDTNFLAHRTHGLSGADLKAVVEEGKLLYAHALLNGKAFDRIEDFFLRAIETSKANRHNQGRRKAAAHGGGRFGFPVFERAEG